jgi:hypothetical protein
VPDDVLAAHEPDLRVEVLADDEALGLEPVAIARVVDACMVTPSAALSGHRRGADGNRRIE